MKNSVTFRMYIGSDGGFFLKILIYNTNLHSPQTLQVLFPSVSNCTHTLREKQRSFWSYCGSLQRDVPENSHRDNTHWLQKV